MNWKIHVLYLGDITVPKAMGTMGLDMNLVLPCPYLAFLLEADHRKILVDTGIHSRFIVDGKAWAGAPAKGGETFLLESLKKVSLCILTVLKGLLSVFLSFPNQTCCHRISM